MVACPWRLLLARLVQRLPHLPHCTSLSRLHLSPSTSPPPIKAAGPASFDPSMAPLPHSDDEDLAEPTAPSATAAQATRAPPVPTVPSATTTSSSITTPNLDSVHPAFRPPPKDESFNARRMRLDRQETLSFIRPQQLSQQPPAESRDRSRSRNADETVDHVFNVDVLTINDDQHEHALHGLPAGWFAKDGSLHLEEIHDWWEIRRNQLIRHHVVARDTLFRPDETGDCPLPLSYLAKDRVTVCGRHRHVDRWRLQDAGQVGWWTGCTVFKVQHRNVKEAEAAFLEHSGGSLVYAGTRAKRAKDAKNLNEKVLSLSDRIAFVEAKRKELESFFTNQVWEFSNLDDAPPERVLKAHFILKWSKHPDGSPRAKARLITQGFRDPDALAGSLDSTSPTWSRLGRTCLMSLSATLGWHNFVADITTAFLQARSLTPTVPCGFSLHQTLGTFLEWKIPGVA